MYSLFQLFFTRAIMLNMEVNKYLSENKIQYFRFQNLQFCEHEASKNIFKLLEVLSDSHFIVLFINKIYRVYW